MKKLLLIVIISNLILLAQDFKKTGTSGFVFLELPVSARAAALGESTLGLADMNSDAVFSNPAGLGFTQGTHSLSLSYAPWLADIKHYAASYSMNAGDAGVFAVSAIALDYGEMQKTVIPRSGGNNVYQILGTYDAKSLAVGLAYSKMLTDRFSFGVHVKYVKESIDTYTASNFIFDGGVLYYTGLSSLRIAAALQNFGVDAQFINDRFKMPTILKLGAAMEVYGTHNDPTRVTLMAEAVHPNDNDERVNTGIEAVWNNMLYVRGGYKFFYDEETYSVGIGVNPQLPTPVMIDFAFSDYGRLGNVSRLTFQIGL